MVWSKKSTPRDWTENRIPHKQRTETDQNFFQSGPNWTEPFGPVSFSGLDRKIFTPNGQYFSWLLKFVIFIMLFFNIIVLIKKYFNRIVSKPWISPNIFSFFSSKFLEYLYILLMNYQHSLTYAITTNFDSMQLNPILKF